MIKSELLLFVCKMTVFGGFLWPTESVSEFLIRADASCLAAVEVKYYCSSASLWENLRLKINENSNRTRFRSFTGLRYVYTEASASVTVLLRNKLRCGQEAAVWPLEEQRPDLMVSGSEAGPFCFSWFVCLFTVPSPKNISVSLPT